MDRLDARNQGLKMCLDHSQSGIEESLLEVEADFQTWLNHPHQRTAWSKLMEHLVSFRWTLDQHFTRVAGEGYLENVASLRPGLYSDLREIECHQCRLIDMLDALIHDVHAGLCRYTPGWRDRCACCCVRTNCIRYNSCRKWDLEGLIARASSPIGREVNACTQIRLESTKVGEVVNKRQRGWEHPGLDDAAAIY